MARHLATLVSLLSCTATEVLTSTLAPKAFPPSLRPAPTPLLATTMSPQVRPALEVVGRWNCGGSTVVDGNGNVWLPDTSVASGGLTARPEEYTNVSFDFGFMPMAAQFKSVLQTERYGDMTFALPVEERGVYLLQLLLVETWHVEPAERMFHIDVQGTRMASAVSMVAEAGFQRPFLKSFTVHIDDRPRDLTLSLSTAASPEPPAIYGLILMTAGEQYDLRGTSTNVLTTSMPHHTSRLPLVTSSVAVQVVSLPPSAPEQPTTSSSSHPMPLTTSPTQHETLLSPTPSPVPAQSAASGNDPFYTRPAVLFGVATIAVSSIVCLAVALLLVSRSNDQCRTEEELVWDNSRALVVFSQRQADDDCTEVALDSSPIPIHSPASSVDSKWTDCDSNFDLPSCKEVSPEPGLDSESFWASPQNIVCGEHQYEVVALRTDAVQVPYYTVATTERSVRRVRFLLDPTHQPDLILDDVDNFS